MKKHNPHGIDLKRINRESWRDLQGNRGREIAYPRYEAAKWRWEFMRRSTTYKRDWLEVQKLREKADPPYGTYEQNENLITQLYLFTIEYQQELKYCEKYGLTEMLDPDGSFDEVVGGMPFFDKKRGVYICNAKQVWGFRIFNEGKRTAAVRLSCQAGDKSKVTISIDFEKVNSIRALIKYITNLILEFYKINMAQQRDRRLYNTDYEIILLAGKLREQGQTHKEIARRLFPRDFSDRSERLKDPEGSAIKKAKRYCDRYSQLINGAYQKITYP